MPITLLKAPHFDFDEGDGMFHVCFEWGPLKFDVIMRPSNMVIAERRADRAMRKFRRSTGAPVKRIASGH